MERESVYMCFSLLKCSWCQGLDQGRSWVLEIQSRCPTWVLEPDHSSHLCCLPGSTREKAQVRSQSWKVNPGSSHVGYNHLNCLAKHLLRSGTLLKLYIKESRFCYPAVTRSSMYVPASFSIKLLMSNKVFIFIIYSLFNCFCSPAFHFYFQTVVCHHTWDYDLFFKHCTQNRQMSIYIFLYACYMAESYQLFTTIFHGKFLENTQQLSHIFKIHRCCGLLKGALRRPQVLPHSTAMQKCPKMTYSHLWHLCQQGKNLNTVCEFFFLPGIKWPRACLLARRPYEISGQFRAELMI